jgi:hypothetical protein
LKGNLDHGSERLAAFCPPFCRSSSCLSPSSRSFFVTIVEEDAHIFSDCKVPLSFGTFQKVDPALRSAPSTKAELASTRSRTNPLVERKMADVQQPEVMRVTHALHFRFVSVDGGPGRRSSSRSSSPSIRSLRSVGGFRLPVRTASSTSTDAVCAHTHFRRPPSLPPLSPNRAHAFDFGAAPSSQSHRFDRRSWRWYGAWTHHDKPATHPAPCTLCSAQLGASCHIVRVRIGSVRYCFLLTHRSTNPKIRGEERESERARVEAAEAQTDAAHAFTLRVPV